ncbi:MAG: type II secretion system protein [Tateyamaria sp.]|uniref:type IV pilus modification PilV family protein n=1 Tax=Tateyamaria sp. TaxID=1929288 RepID=UPI00329E5647
MTRRAGYTLLEVLVAFAIMASILAVILPGQSQMLRQSSDAEITFLATDYAQSLMDRLGVSEAIVPGVQTDVYRDWRVAIETRPLIDFESFFSVTISIEDERGRQIATTQSVKILVE